MTYALQQDLVERFGAVELAQLTDEAAGQTINAATVARALADADAEIDGYLGARYAVPLAMVPPLVVRLACDIARYRLFDDRATEAVRKRYEDAVTVLRRIADGTVTLGVAAANTPPAAAGGGTVRVAARERVFSDGLLGAFDRTGR